ncbi:MAG: hypothetical protein IJI45_03375 [Anaerolineaceae bacterium]|nr:hypothetical protein [Anaerolineaceae bacterium]
MQYHDPINPAPFQRLFIPAPEQLKNDEDYTTLFQFMISEFCLSINEYDHQYGYGNRQRLLASMLKVLKEYIPVREPELITEYPGSLERMKGLMVETILCGASIAQEAAQAASVMN